MQFECPLPLSSYDTITLAHGGGGKLSQKLLTDLFLPLLHNSYLDDLHDGATLPIEGGRVAFSTDSFVVSPPFFPGGNIGHLAVFGTANDLAMCGARPRYLSLALILEEGFAVKDLWQIVATIRECCDQARLQVVTGDLKVVERGKGDGVFINTTGIGLPTPGTQISPKRVSPGDVILLNGPIAEHGIAILSIREGLSFETELRSDTTALWPLVENLLLACGASIHALRDATRGGIASVLNEIAQASRTGMVIDERGIPVREDVRGACEILGLDPLYVANEGKFVAFVARDEAEKALTLMRQHPLGEGACVLGEVVAAHPGLVRLRTPLGGTRVVEMMSGEQLPRIC